MERERAKGPAIGLAVEELLLATTTGTSTMRLLVSLAAATAAACCCCCCFCCNNRPASELLDLAGAAAGTATGSAEEAITSERVSGIVTGKEMKRKETKRRKERFECEGGSERKRR